MNRMEREVRTIEKMIALYCKKNHIGTDLCEECTAFQNYAFERLRRCPFQEKKSTCQKCTVHCYKPDMKEKARTIMRESGPKMILHNPYFAIMHIIDGFRKAPTLPKKRSK
ncbi:MAG: nitrous oxide-stimulated promoter family protein [Bacilli bacterium]